ncbi:hypothetical protein [Sulfitobacter aestuariivivens]|uniref:Uncharacterized protein n=1 Tax=Sulfitobacter aestuariivivens TaxID=2766981 RepID=A0A927HCX4_9RHOB|nr:hypothetical protein [Sulfitobacter aestuariivivens]MBD3663052.1 hypothetical protein [Sulfitobacter aestuariivivens]
MTDLNTRLLAAHAADDRDALITLYQQAADAADDPIAQAFFLTHAYVFALEMGDAQAPHLRQRLVDMGCEEPLQPPS